MVARRTDYDEGNRIVREMFGAAGPEERGPAASLPINVDTVQVLVWPHTFSYRGRRFVIKRVPWLEGITLEYLTDKIRELLSGDVGREQLEELTETFLDAYDLLWKLMKRHWWQRQNPFEETMTLGEFYAVVSFCFECRMALPNLALGTTMGSKTKRSARRGTMRMISRNLSRLSRSGRLKDSRSPTTIFGSVSAGLGWRQRGNLSLWSKRSGSRMPSVRTKRETGG